MHVVPEVMPVTCCPVFVCVLGDLRTACPLGLFAEALLTPSQAAGPHLPGRVSPCALQVPEHWLAQLLRPSRDPFRLLH